MNFKKIILLSIGIAVICVSGIYMYSTRDTKMEPIPETSAGPAYIEGSTIMPDVWIYPDDPKSFDKLREIGRVQAVKVEFLHINDDGTIRQINKSQASPNGYSQDNVDLIKRHSNEQYITVSGLMEGTQRAMQDSQTIATIVTLANKTGFNVELDWEDYGGWTDDYYRDYKQFITDLRQELKKTDKKLMIDGPAIPDQTAQDWYKWKYEELAPLVDYVVMMVYDYQFDYGAGTAIAPKQWSLDAMNWLKQKAGTEKGIVGIGAYGYAGNTSDNRVATNTSENIARRARGASIDRTADGELKALKDGQYFVYADTKTMQIRLQQVEQSDLKRLSVWSLGSNPWFN